MSTTGYRANQILCNLSIKANCSILTYIALAINSYKLWELKYDKPLLFHRGNMFPPPAQMRACMSTQQPVIHMSPYPTGLFDWPTLYNLPLKQLDKYCFLITEVTLHYKPTGAASLTDDTCEHYVQHMKHSKRLCQCQDESINT